MTLRRKTIVVTLLTLVGLVTTLHLAATRILLDGFKTIEHHQMHDQIGWALHEIHELTNSLAHRDWSSWDDTYGFVESHSPEYIRSNLTDESLRDIKVSALAFIDKSQQIVFEKELGIDGKAGPLSADLRRHLLPGSRLLNHTSTTNAIKGLLSTSRGLALIASLPIVTSKSEGPIRGSIVFVRYVDPGEIVANLDQFAREPQQMQIYALDDPAMPTWGRSCLQQLQQRRHGSVIVDPQDPGNVSAAVLLRDVYGSPCRLLTITRPRTVFAQGQQSIHYLLRSIVVTGCIFALVTLLVCERLMLRRLQDLSQGVRQITLSHDFGKRLGIPGRDELARLGRDIDDMLASLQRSQAAQQESELRYRSVLDHTSDGVFIFSAESGQLLQANAAFQKLIGNADRPLAELNVKEFLDSPVESANLGGEHTYRRPDGALVYVEAAVHEITFDACRAYCVVVHDITERKRAEEDLASRYAALEQLVEERSQALVSAQRQLMQNEKLASVGQLAAGIAHEINTPIQYVGDNLRAISDSLQDLVQLVEEHQAFVEKVKTGEATADVIQSIEHAAEQHDWDFLREDTPKAIEQGLEGVQRVAHIVRAMKDFSHVREEVSAVDINHSVTSTLTVARNEYKYVADAYTELGELPPVECFPGEINQVLLNMVVNAAHAIADTQKRGLITIRTRAVDDEVEIAISDTGTGIPEKIQGKIFDPFFTTKEVGKGTGQGLYISHQIIVVKHGGSLRFETEAGKGTTFFIRLPVHAKQQAAEGAAQA